MYQILANTAYDIVYEKTHSLPLSLYIYMYIYIYICYTRCNPEHDDV